MQIQVQQLQLGDVMSGSKETIMSGPTDGILVPKGKLRIGLRKPNGHERWTYWGKYTKVNIQDRKE